MKLIVKSKTVDDLFFKEIREKSCLDIASMMMNATPDIVVIYGYEGAEDRKYAKVLECKYKSKEGTDRTRQRDFNVLRNIGYPIEYIREYRYIMHGIM